MKLNAVLLAAALLLPSAAWAQSITISGGPTTVTEGHHPITLTVRTFNTPPGFYWLAVADYSNSASVSDVDTFIKLVGGVQFRAKTDGFLEQQENFTIQVRLYNAQDVLLDIASMWITIRSNWGDMNGDDKVNNHDIVLAMQGGKYGTGQRATYWEGDLNNDGLFDQQDLVIFGQNWTG
ncbi:MAG: hypothetical protein ACR2RE_13175 [Geminicoccaceae bacterium]